MSSMPSTLTLVSVVCSGLGYMRPEHGPRRQARQSIALRPSLYLISGRDHQPNTYRDPRTRSCFFSTSHREPQARPFTMDL